jgi:hypothetical protein
MPYYKFDKNDTFVNTVKLYPEVRFVIYSGSAYYNSTPDISGAFTGSIRCTDPGSISLFEMNVDRGPLPPGLPGWLTRIGAHGAVVPNTGLVYPWITKDGTRLNLRTNTAASFNNSLPGDIITGAPFPYTSSISKEFYTATTPRYTPPEIVPMNSSGDDPQVVAGTATVSHIRALKNTINYYRYISPQFEYSSSANSILAGFHNRDFDSSSLGLVSIPSIFYGSQIKKGTVNLEIYYTGSLIARAQDSNRNGELIQTYGPASLTDTVVGLVLYNEGFVVLTSSSPLADAASTDFYTSSANASIPQWDIFGQSISGSIIAPKTTFIMEMSGTTNTQVITMMATAPKGELNHSNNPSYLSASTETFVSTGSSGYIESAVRPIKNIVSSAYADPAATFEKTTYISKVGVYDSDHNLIGVAKVATPTKKTVKRDFTFKIKLDI